MRGNLKPAMAVLAAALCGCSGASTPASHSGDSRTPATTSTPAPIPGAAPRARTGAPRAHVSEEEAQKPHPELPPERRALLVTGQPGHPEERWIDAEAAEGAGYTLVDLSDDWTPFIFAEQWTEDGQPLPNRYRRIFLGLANDELDEDGEPLEPGAKNYLELYGIPPSLSVLRARFVQDEQHPCHDQESAEAIDAVETVTYVAPADLKKDERRLAKIRDELEKARRKARVETLEELAEKQPALAPKVKMLARRAAEKPAMAAVERRLTCEGLLGKGTIKHIPGIYDDAMRLAVRHFQQKHMIYEANYLRRKTVDALARSLIDNDYDSLVRALRERVVSAAAIVEDGTVSKSRNLVDEYLKITLDQLQLTDGPTALAFFKRHPAAEFKRLRAAIKLPARPDYYADNMDLSIVVDRGDVWYDLPFSADGKYKPQPRKKYPSLTLYTKAGGKLTALARWRTTIGGWRSEQAGNGYEYFRYKQSDVGPRVIRNVVSGPVWIAPASTPIRSLTKGKTVNDRWMRVVNYDELGPGYLSAYGVVAGYFVVPGQPGRPDWDNGVRAHGSSDYLSIYSANGFSHGCHRLPNHIAVRMYSFILRHRNMTVVGDKPMNFARQFLFKDTVYEIRLPSRGYYFVLEPPLPVNVLEGEIKGDAKKPIAGYVATPWGKYPPGLAVPAAPDSAEAKAGGGGGGAAVGGGGDD
jgi:hypothetical protein